jgi:hypothetical protein
MGSQSHQSFGSPISSPGLRVPNNSPAYGFPADGRAQPHVLNRALEAMMPNTTQQANNSRFFHPQQVTTRQRRSAGIPSLRPNGPRNNSQSQFDEMNNAFFPDQPYEDSQENGFNHQNIWRRQPDYSQHHEYDQQWSNGQQGGSRNHTASGSQNNLTQRSIIVGYLFCFRMISDLKTGR